MITLKGQTGSQARQEQKVDTISPVQRFLVGRDELLHHKSRNMIDVYMQKATKLGHLQANRVTVDTR